MIELVVDEMSQRSMATPTEWRASNEDAVSDMYKILRQVEYLIRYALICQPPSLPKSTAKQ